MLKPGLMLLIPVFFGCETQNDLGIKYGLDTDANVKFVEFTLPATNVYIDSLRTDRENRILVGKHFDPLTGGVSAEGYFQFSYEKGPLPRGVNESSDTIKLDSIIVTFETGATIPQRGDTYIEFDLYELQDTLENGAIYLSNLQQATGSMIGSYSKSINVALDTLFRIKLDNIYAQEIFSQIGDIAEDDSKTISTSVFKSLGIISGSSSESIASMNLLSDTSRMIIFSSPVDPDAKDTTYLTYFRLSGKHYTYLDRNRLGSGYDGITEKSDFALSNGQTIIDPLAGISTSFSIKELEEFFKENERILINNAITSFEFISEDNRDTLVSFMSYFRKADKGIYGPAILSNPFGNIVMSDNGYLGRESLPAVATLNSNKSEILFPSTLFYQQLLNVYDAGTLTFINPSTGASIQIDDLVLLSSESTSLQRTIFKPNGIKLRLYYTEVDQ